MRCGSKTLHSGDCQWLQTPLRQQFSCSPFHLFCSMPLRADGGLACYQWKTKDILQNETSQHQNLCIQLLWAEESSFWILWVTRTTVRLSASPVRKPSKQVGGTGKLDTLSKLSSREAINVTESAQGLETPWAFSEQPPPPFCKVKGTNLGAILGEELHEEGTFLFWGHLQGRSHLQILCSDCLPSLSSAVDTQTASSLGHSLPLPHAHAVGVCSQLHLHHIITNFQGLQKGVEAEELGATTMPLASLQTSVIWMVELGEVFLKWWSWMALHVLSVLTPEGTAAHLSSLFQCLLIHLY